MVQNARHLVQKKKKIKLCHTQSHLGWLFLHHNAFIYDMLAGKLLKSKYTKEKKNN
jgi:hypothetical protein